LRQAALALAAALAGASGLALETLLLDGAGLGLGYGRAAALGLPAFLAAWAIGAQRAGRSRRSPRAALLAAGLSAALSAWPAAWVVLAGGRGSGGFLTACSTLVAIAAAGFCQGAFLAPLARAGGSVALLLAANLAGAAAGSVWIADRLVAAAGRSAAALAAGGAAALAGGIGAWAAAKVGVDRRLVEQTAREEGALGWKAAAWIVALTTAWLVTLEWIGLRLGVLWLGGMQPTLRNVLAASLVALALGAALVPRLVPRGGAGALWVLLAGSIGSLWPWLAPSAIRALGLEERSRLAGAFSLALALVLPALLPFGGLLAVLHRALPLESGERLGRLFLHEASGALLGLPVIHFWLLPRVGLGGALALLELCGAGAILALSRSVKAARFAAVVPVLLGAWAWNQPSPALRSPPLSNPAFRLLSFEEDCEFAVSVVDDGILGERTLLTDGFRAAGTGSEYRYMQVLGHLPVLLSPHPRQVAVLALGTGTTVGAVALHPEVDRIDVLEISPAVVRTAPWFEEKNRGALAEGWPGLQDGSDGDARVVVRLGDGRATLARTHERYDVITMEPLLPDSPFGVYLYTREFYGRARGALAPQGIVCQWVPPHALEPATFLAVLDAFARAFPWSSVWLSGTQVILIGAEAEPSLDPARFRASGELARELGELGLETPERCLGRFIALGARVPRSARALSDADPWIVYRPQRKGTDLLADLPRNLGFLRSVAEAPPRAWIAAAGPGATEQVEGMAALRAGREAHAFFEARLRGWSAKELEAPALEPSLRRARSLLGEAPELLDFSSELAFLAELRGGVSALASDPSRAGARSALPSLREAARLRPRRGDVHLYVAVALERLGDSASQAEIASAVEACPAIARTPEGRRSRTLGLSDSAWSRLEASAATAATELFRKETARAGVGRGQVAPP